MAPGPYHVGPDLVTLGNGSGTGGLTIPPSPSSLWTDQT